MNLTSFFQIHFHIDRLENQVLLPKNVLSPHKHLFHELFFVESGEISHIVDFKEFTAGENTLSFISVIDISALSPIIPSFASLG